MIYGAACQNTNFLAVRVLPCRKGFQSELRRRLACCCTVTELFLGNLGHARTPSKTIYSCSQSVSYKREFWSIWWSVSPAFEFTDVGYCGLAILNNFAKKKRKSAEADLALSLGQRPIQNAFAAHYLCTWQSIMDASIPTLLTLQYTAMTVIF